MDQWAESDISCPQCRSTNLADLGPDRDPCRHLLICKDCGDYFQYPPRRRQSPEARGESRPAT
jgi:hypothetical protein